METQQTLILVKPDGVSQGHIGEIISRIEHKGYRIDALKVTQATDELLAEHYADKVNKPYHPDMKSYMQEGPIVAIVASGVEIISVFRRMAGATNPSEAAFGTIRGDFGREYADDKLRNVVHSSDSPEAAQREMKIWFGNDI